MLILTRKVEQRIVIRDTRSGEVITLQVTELSPVKVRLGFEAAPHYAIDREEIAISKALRSLSASPDLRPTVGARPRVPAHAPFAPVTPLRRESVDEIDRFIADGVLDDPMLYGDGSVPASSPGGPA